MYYRNSYGYLMNYSGESNKLPNTNQYSNPSYNINTNYSQKKPPSTYRTKKKTFRNN